MTGTQHDGVRWRSFLVSGWTLRGHTQLEKEGIQQYLNTGDPTTLPYTYQRLRKRLRETPDLAKQMQAKYQAHGRAEQ